MLRMSVDLQGATANTRVETGAGTFATFPPMDAENNLMGDVLLAATARAEGLFGISADAVAPGDVLLDFPQGTVRYSCSETVLYGDVPPYPELGMALKRSGTTWFLGAPAPFNNAGAAGTPGVCPPEPDAGDLSEAALDASTADASIDEAGGEGCGCRLGSGGSRTPAGPWSAFLLGLIFALITRRQTP
jgi:MYXO-CTERM domain-containing protein